MLTRNPAGLAQAKQRASNEAALSPPTGMRALAPTPPGLNQPGLASTDNAVRNDGTPPDTTGAIGPSNYVEFVNSKVGVYSKTDLSLQSSADLDTFVGATNDNVFDVQIQWDEPGQRWIYLADDCSNGDCSSVNRLAYGFSKTTDPSDLAAGWCHYFLRTDNAGGTGLFDDFPKLGHDDNHLLFGTNVFGEPTPQDFVSSRIWSVPKPAAGTITTCPAQGTAHYFTGSAASPVEDGTLATSPLKTSDNKLAFTPVPANTMNSQAAGFIVAADFSSGTASQIMAWHMGGTTTSPSLVADGKISVGGYQPPGNAPQPGSSDQIDTADGRLTQAVAQADPDASGAEAVWTQHTVNGPGGRSVAAWYELLPATTTARQQGTVSDPSDFVFNAAIAPTMTGNEAAITYNTGSASQLVQAHYQSRVSNMPLGAMHADVTLGSSDGIDEDFSCPSSDPTQPSCRWGDYSAMSPDPVNTHEVWGSNQLVTTPSGNVPRWTTRNFATVPNAWPIASFTFGPTKVFGPKPVSFDGSSSSDPDGGSITGFEWDFGDGSPHSSGATVTHRFQQPGTYTVRLTVTDSDQGLTDSTTQQVTVQSGAPLAVFSVSPAVAGRGTTVTFDGSASHDVEGPGGIASYAWDFNGDGTVDQTTTQPVTTTTYSSLGTFAPKLIVTDADDGLQSQPATQSEIIQNLPPTAAFTASPARPGVAQRVTFSAAGSTDPDGTQIRFRWDLNGDGSFETATGTTPTVQHVYRSPGLFQVGLEVQDADGATAIVSHALRVAVLPTIRAVLRFPRAVRLAALRAGLRGKVGCGRACVVTVSLQVPRALARALKRELGAKTGIGKARAMPKNAKLVRVKLKPAPAIARALGTVPPFTLTVRAVPSRAGFVARAATARVRVTP